MLVVDIVTGIVTHAAGDPGVWFGRSDWQGQPLSTLIPGEAASAALEVGRSNDRGKIARLVIQSNRGTLDLTAYPSSGHLVIEAEDALPVSMSSGLLFELEEAAAGFERAATMQQLWDTAVQEFRRLIGFDRVMLYKFRDDDSGIVVAENTASGQRSFLNHHFPASDIPRQARALYLRNLHDRDHRATTRPLRPPLDALVTSQRFWEWHALEDALRQLWAKEPSTFLETALYGVAVLARAAPESAKSENLTV